MAYEEYVASTAGQLDHFFINKVTPYLVDYREGKPIDLEMMNRSKKGFIEGLQETVEENYQEYGGVTHANLQEMIEIARSDWNFKETVEALFVKFRELRPSRV